MFCVRHQTSNTCSERGFTCFFPETWEMTQMMVSFYLLLHLNVHCTRRLITNAEVDVRFSAFVLTWFHVTRFLLIVRINVKNKYVSCSFHCLSVCELSCNQSEVCLSLPVSTLKTIILVEKGNNPSNATKRWADPVFCSLDLSVTEVIWTHRAAPF